MSKEQEIEGKFWQFNRVLISYIDFQQAHEIASIILEEKLHEEYPLKNRIKLEALNAGMVISYCRPFSGNKSVPDLPNRFINNLEDAEKEIHDALMKDRNTVIAHSNSEAWNMRPYYESISGKNILVPLCHGVHKPFFKDITEKICILSKKQMETCFLERERLEKELRPYIPVADS
tara:strand:- start:958 stop:1485 length:528 start_codon:yes stop_codon:yes gene_type:complete